MIEFDFFDNLIDFIEELYELLKEDWEKFKLFIKENKTYVIWFFIALITLQITDLMSLGSSWDRYCKKNNIQKGGGNESAEPEEEKSDRKKQKDLLLEKAALKKEAKKAAEGEDSVKGIDKKLSFFNKLKGKVQTGVGQHGLAGPVLGNLDGIFGAVGGMFTLAATILIFFGILSLPVLIFLVITYCVIKMLVGKLALY